MPELRRPGSGVRVRMRASAAPSTRSVCHPYQRVLGSLAVALDASDAGLAGLASVAGISVGAATGTVARAGAGAEARVREAAEAAEAVEMASTAAARAKSVAALDDAAAAAPATAAAVRLASPAAAAAVVSVAAEEAAAAADEAPAVEVGSPTGTVVPWALRGVASKDPARQQTSVPRGMVAVPDGVRLAFVSLASILIRSGEQERYQLRSRGGGAKERRPGKRCPREPTGIRQPADPPQQRYQYDGKVAPGRYCLSFPRNAACARFSRSPRTAR